MISVLIHMAITIWMAMVLRMMMILVRMIIAIVRMGYGRENQESIALNQTEMNMIHFRQTCQFTNNIVKY